MRVRVPFGQSERVALVLEPTPNDEQETRPILEVLDELPLLDAETLACLRWAAAYYHHPLGDVVFAALPKILRGERRLEVEALESTPSGRDALSDGAARGERQRQALEALVASKQPVPAATLGPATVRRRLVEKGWADATRITAPADWPLPAEPGSEAAPALNAQQQDAVDALGR